MKIKFVIALLMMTFAMSVNAQPAAEIEATVKKMENPATPCNKAPEAFNSFIKKFSTDEAFMKSRISLPEKELTDFAEVLKPENMTAKLPYEKDGDEFYQSWGELQYNKAYLECGIVDSYCTHTFEFTRKGGLWHLTHIVPGE